MSDYFLGDLHPNRLMSTEFKRIFIDRAKLARRAATLGRRGFMLHFPVTICSAFLSKMPRRVGVI